MSLLFYNILIWVYGYIYIYEREILTVSRIFNMATLDFVPPPTFNILFSTPGLFLFCDAVSKYEMIFEANKLTEAG